MKSSKSVPLVTLSKEDNYQVLNEVKACFLFEGSINKNPFLSFKKHNSKSGDRIQFWIAWMVY
jgi:hypothetical protein